MKRLSQMIVPRRIRSIFYQSFINMDQLACHSITNTSSKLLCFKNIVVLKLKIQIPILGINSRSYHHHYLALGLYLYCPWLYRLPNSVTTGRSIYAILDTMLTSWQLVSYLFNSISRLEFFQSIKHDRLKLMEGFSSLIKVPKELQ